MEETIAIRILNPGYPGCLYKALSVIKSRETRGSFDFSVVKKGIPKQVVSAPFNSLAYNYPNAASLCR